MNTTKLLASVLFATCAMPVFAQSAGSDFRETLRDHGARIAEGARSGDLTRQEERRLRDQQFRIRSDLRTAEADGRITRDERRQLRRDQDEAERMIERLMTNRRTN